MTKGKSVVWVLGAGFSQPLGAPELKNLITPNRLADIHAHYSPEKHPALNERYIKFIASLYEHGVDRDRRLWGDPEEFLDYLDAAANHDGPARFWVNKLAEGAPGDWSDVGPDAKADKLHDAARRMMAAACMAFLEEKDSAQERWQPYWDWIRLVKAEDTIITFNYDLLVERLLEEGPKQTPNVETARIEVLGPSEEPNPDCAPVLKLHGSVNWRRAPSGYEVTRDPHFAINCADKELAILSPGSVKLRESKGGLKKLWDRAVEGLKQADAIVLLGYRFPPSDAYARRTLLSAIADTKNETAPVLVTRIVLGPNSEHADRTAQMVRYAYERTGRTPADTFPTGKDKFNVRVQHMYTQDFLSVVKRDQLFDEIATLLPGRRP
jgi:hypothetical protein